MDLELIFSILRGLKIIWRIFEFLKKDFGLILQFILIKILQKTEMSSKNQNFDKISLNFSIKSLPKKLYFHHIKVKQILANQKIKWNHSTIWQSISCHMSSQKIIFLWKRTLDLTQIFTFYSFIHKSISDCYRYLRIAQKSNLLWQIYHT